MRVRKLLKGADRAAKELTSLLAEDEGMSAELAWLTGVQTFRDSADPIGVVREYAE